jgi:hypothetical protein
VQARTSPTEKQQTLAETNATSNRKTALMATDSTFAGDSVRSANRRGWCRRDSLAKFSELASLRGPSLGISKHLGLRVGTATDEEQFS